MKLASTILFLCVLVVVAAAQPITITGDPSYNSDSPYNRLYNTRSVFTFSGTVVGTETAPPMKGMGNAVTMLVKDKGGTTWHVDVGPQWYVVNQRTQIKVKDRVKVTGSKVQIDGSPVVLAEQIVHAKNVLALRRPAGRPYWDAVYSEAPVDDGINHRQISGTITNIDVFNDGTNGPTQRVTIHTDEGDFLVALAPTWYVQHQRALAQLAVGPYVDINLFAPDGVPIQPYMPGNPAPPIVFARSIGYGNQWAVLRSVNGVPMWYGIGGN